MGKLCGATPLISQNEGLHITDLWLTDKGIQFNYSFRRHSTDSLFFSSRKVRVLGSTPIKLDSIELYDSSNNIINYYLPNVPNGILGIRGYKKILIKSILPNVDWQISYEDDDASIYSFVHSFIPSYGAEIILHTTDVHNFGYILPENRAPNYDYPPQDTIYNVNIKDTLKRYREYGLCEYLAPQRFLTLAAALKPSSDIYWATAYGLSHSFNRSGVSGYQSTKFDISDSRFNNLSEITTSTTDNNGNLYIAGRMSMVNSYKYDGLNNYSIKNSEDAFISKFNKEGVLLWTTIYGSSANDEIGAIELSSNKFLYASGYISMHFLEDSLRKMAINNNYISNSLWKNDFPLQQKSNSLFFDTGSLFLLKFDTNGIRQWATLLGKDYGIIDDNGRKRPYIIDCEISSSTINSKDEIYFSGTYRPSIYRKDTNDKLPNIEQIESLLSLPIKGDENSSKWTMQNINSKSGDRFTGTNQWNSFPFILKIDSSDNLVWSTYFFSTQPILAMEVDSKDNLYIGGNTTDGNLPTISKKEAYFCERSLLPTNNLNRIMKEVERRSYLAKFNTNNKLIWCTYLESKVSPNSKTYIRDIDIDFQDNLLITGYTTNREFSLHKKAGAYYTDYNSSTVAEQNGFIMEFDRNYKLKRQATILDLPISARNFSPQKYMP